MKKIIEQLKLLANQLDSYGHHTTANKIETLLIKTAQHIDPEKRFWAKVKKTPSCWLWIGAKDSGGYGICTIGGRNYSTHKLSWEWKNNTSVPSGQVLLHSCDTPSCVNPAHLRPGSQKNNVDDRVSKDRSAKGEDNGRARLKKKDVEKIKNLRDQGWTETSIAKLFDVGRSTISNILHNRTWNW